MQIEKETENLRKLIYAYDNGTSQAKIFEEKDPGTGEKKYWTEQFGVVSSSANSSQQITVQLIIKMRDKQYFAHSVGALGSSFSTLEWSHQNSQCIDLTQTSFKTAVARAALPKNWIVKGWADKTALEQAEII